MPGHDEAEITGFFAAEPDRIAWPYPMYRRWQEGAGVVRWGSGPATIVTRYDDVKDVMAGAYPIRQDAYRFGELAESTLRRLPSAQHEIFFEVLDFEGLFMSRQDGDEHRRLRRVASRFFTPRRMEALRDSVQRHVDDLVDAMDAGGVADLKAEMADRLPVRVILDLLAIPPEDRARIWEWSEAVARLFSLDETSLADAHDALRAFRAYVGDTVEELRRTGRGSELARTMLESRDDEAMTEDELVAMFLLLLFGGTETTTNLLGNGFLALQRNREQWELLVENPSLVRQSVEELLRYDTPHHYLPRLAVGDFAIGGVDVTAGQTVIIVMGAANRDPDHFEDPDVLDLGRHDRGDHLSFAFGAHYCLGAALARLEAEIVFTTLVTRFPDARLVADDVPYGGSAMLRSIRSLPTRLR